jgi:hypothetical protein
MFQGLRNYVTGNEAKESMRIQTYAQSILEIVNTVLCNLSDQSAVNAMPLSVCIQ